MARPHLRTTQEQIAGDDEGGGGTLVASGSLIPLDGPSEPRSSPRSPGVCLKGDCELPRARMNPRDLSDSSVQLCTATVFILLCPVHSTFYDLFN